MDIRKTTYLGSLFCVALLSMTFAQAAKHPASEKSFPPQATVKHLHQLDCKAGEVVQFDGASWVCTAKQDTITSISQDIAIAGDATPGDTPGFPVTISKPGSYRLTGNLTVPDELTTAIFIDSDEVTIDLGGYAIIGPVVCTGTTVSCVPMVGFGNGIGASSFVGKNVSVLNGTIRGMGNTGIFLRENCRIENVTATSNAGSGISVSTESIVKGNKVSYNWGFGISMGAGGIATGNTAYRNAIDGIYASGATISGNNVSQNNRNGIDTRGEGSTITGNTSTGNHGHGMNAGYGSTVSGNTVRGNGGDGIIDSEGTFNTGGGSIIGNTLQANSGFGLNLKTDTGYANNVITQNNGGNANPQTSGGIEIGTNLCGTDTTCP